MEGSLTTAIIMNRMSAASPHPVGLLLRRSRGSAPPAAEEDARGLLGGLAARSSRERSGAPSRARRRLDLADAVRVVALADVDRDPLHESTGGLWGETDEGLGKTAAWARTLGIKTLLKPHLWVRHGEWQGDIAMATDDAWARWFASYEAFIVHYARLAEGQRDRGVRGRHRAGEDDRRGPRSGRRSSPACARSTTASSRIARTGTTRPSASASGTISISSASRLLPVGRRSTGRRSSGSRPRGRRSRRSSQRWRSAPGSRSHSPRSGSNRTRAR